MFNSQILQWREAKDRLGILISRMREQHRAVARFRDADDRRFEDAGGVEGQPFTLRESLAHAERVARTFAGQKLKAGTPVQVATWNQCMDSLRNVESHFEQFQSAWLSVGGRSDPVRIHTGSSLMDSSGNVIVSFTHLSVSLVQAADGLLGALASLTGTSLDATTANAADIDQGVVVDQASEAGEALNRTKAAAREVQDLSDRLKAETADFTVRRVELEERLLQVSDLLSKAEADAVEKSESLKQLQNAATETAAALSGRMEDAGRVRTQIEALQKEIAIHESGLDGSQKRIVRAEGEAQALLKRQTGQSSKVTQLVRDAEAMLSGATVAGLASGFAKEREDLDKAMRGAFWWFIVSIALLTISTGLLAAYLFNLPLHIAGVDFGNPAKGGDPTVTLAGVISRIVLVLGPFWLTLFSSRRYRQLFDLRQQYSHKYNLAFSMEGFKRQSKTHADAIAAWVFSIVAANPVSQPKGRPMDESPATSLREFAMGVFEGAFDQVGFKKSGAANKGGASDE